MPLARLRSLIAVLFRNAEWRLRTSEGEPMRSALCRFTGVKCSSSYSFNIFPEITSSIISWNNLDIHVSIPFRIVDKYLRFVDMSWMSIGQIEKPRPRLDLLINLRFSLKSAHLSLRVSIYVVIQIRTDCHP